MATIDSSTGGYLQSGALSPPLGDASLDAIFQAAVTGITGLPGNLIRPMWQPNPPKMPEPSVTWAAMGVTAITPDAGPYIEHQSSGGGADNYQRHEDIELFCTFYGPQGQSYAAALRDGFAIPQNGEMLGAQGISWVECGPVRSIPELFNQQWIRRYDLTIRFRRQVKRTYQVLTILSSSDVLTSDTIGAIKHNP